MLELRRQNVITEIKKNCGTASEFLIKYNPDIQNAAANNLERVYFGKAPSIANIASVYNYELYVSWFMVQIDNLNDYCKVKEKMQNIEAEQLANIVYANYPYLKASEILLFFFRLKSGVYGTFYGSIDPQKISVALIEFLKQRLVEMRNIENKQIKIEMEKLRIEWAKTAVTRQQYEQIKSKEIWR